MRTIVHISDLHFGRIDPEVVKSLAKAIKKIDPKIIIVSGDLTQRAKVSEFKEAKKFISRLPGDKIIIPGNHDVPLFNLKERLSTPFKRYQKHINKNLEPFYQDDLVAVLGINTARPLKLKHGKITERQVRLIESRLTEKSKNQIKILVGHHPFDLPEKFGSGKIIRGASGLMQKIVDCGVDLVLGGHMHISYIGSTARRYKFKGKDAIVLQAATVSKRSRGEEPSFNLIKVGKNKIFLERMIYQSKTDTFEPFFPETFYNRNGFWSK